MLGLDYVFDALEESIRDIMEFMLEGFKLDVANSANGGLFLQSTYSNEENLEKPETEFVSNNVNSNNLNVIDIDIDNLKQEKQPLTSEDIHSVKTNLCDETRLLKLLDRNQTSKKLDNKYNYFNRILKEFAKSNVYVTKLKLLRAYFLFTLILGTYSFSAYPPINGYYFSGSCGLLVFSYA